MDVEREAYGASSGGNGATAPLGGSSGTAAEPLVPVADRLLEELREYHVRACRERNGLQRERTDLQSRLARAERELRTEELVGSDLACRAARLECAIRRERALCDGLLGQGVVLTNDFGPFGSSDGPGLDAASAEPLTKRCADLLSQYLERLPTERERSCRDYLRASLRESGVAPKPPCLVAEPAPPAVSVAEHLQDPETLARVGTADSTALGVPPWGQPNVLRSHLDGVRGVLIDELAGVLVSCGEDALVKAWDLPSIRKGAPQFDELEPYITLRGHTAAVLALAYRAQDRILFSGGVDSYIRVWRLPDSNHCSMYSSNVTSQLNLMRAGLLLGHTDSVWHLDRHPHLPHLLSASADGSIGFWTAKIDVGTQVVEMGLRFTLPAPGTSSGTAMGSGRTGPLDSPTCAVWLPTNLTHILGGYASSRVAIFDVRRENQVVTVLAPSESAADGLAAAPHAQVTSACCHTVEQLAVTGHADRRARMIDFNSGKFVQSYGDHPDAVTSVCIDPVQGHSLVTGCHDGCVRSFDLRTGRCRQVLRMHEAKYGEALHCVHLGSRLLASAGADGTVAVLSYAQ